MVSDATAYERGVNIAQTGLIPNFREGVQANPWFQLGYQMGLKHGARAAGMMSRAKSEFPAVAARLQASRPGAPDTFAIEDRFYFGQGRKERFADDAKQIADTILKQLGGGRFIAMTGAKNLAFASNPPGLHMSIGRGAKSGIKYLRVNYDRGSDTYTMKFLNNSGGTVREQSFVHADQLRRVFTSTTGFDTSL